MPVRSRPVAFGRFTSVAGTTDVQLYVVPADRTLICKHAILDVATGVAGAVILYVQRTGVAAVTVWSGSGLAAGAIPIPDLAQGVLQEGDQVRLNAAAGYVIDYWISGALLQGDPA